MQNEKIILTIDETGNMSIPLELKNIIKKPMLLTFIDENTLIVITENDLVNIGKSSTKENRRKMLRVLKANSCEFKLNETNKVEIPDYILKNINFNTGVVILNKDGNFKIVNANLVEGLEENYGKQI